MAMSSLGGTKVLVRQAARCAALAKQTHDEEGRERYLRLEQMYLQLLDAEERADSVKGDKNVNTAA